MTTLAFVLSLLAQDVLDPQGPSDPRGHDVVRNPRTGDCVVAWISGGGQVMARRYTSQQTWDAAVELGAGARQQIAISCGSEQYLVVWSTGAEIYGRVLDAQLVPAGDSFRISDFDDPGEDRAPDAAWNKDKWLVVWAHTNPELRQGRAQFARHFEVNDDIAGRFVTPAGMPAASFRLTDDGIDTKNPSVAAQGDGWFAAWQEHPGPGRLPRVWGAPVAADGRVGIVAPYGTGTGGNQVQPRVATMSDGRAMLAWSTQDGEAVGTRRVQPNGRYVAPAAVLGWGARGTPSIAWFPERGQYLVVYEMVSPVTGSIDVKGQFIDAATGQTVETVKLLRTDWEERNPRVAAQPNGQPLTVGQRNTGQNRELVASTAAEGGGREESRRWCSFAAGTVGMPWGLVIAGLLALVLSCKR